MSAVFCVDERAGEGFSGASCTLVLARRRGGRPTVTCRSSGRRGCESTGIEELFRDMLIIRANKRSEIKRLSKLGQRCEHKVQCNNKVRDGGGGGRSVLLDMSRNYHTLQAVTRVADK